MQLNTYILKQIVTDEARAIFKALLPDETRFVGGVVRDLLCEKVASDIDLATTAYPEVVISRLEKLGAKVIPTGLKHGTITAVFRGKVFEITTLRRDVKTDGRHADVVFTNSFEADSNRRDFTFNALFMDLNGKIFDYHSGIDDLKAKRLRFIGDAKARIEEDYLRILRYFRFFARLNCVKTSPEMAAILRETASSISNLSWERVTDEVFKILENPNPRRAWMEMAQFGILNEIRLKEPDLNALNNCLTLFGHKASPLLRLCCLYHDKRNVYLSKDPYLKFSNAQLKTFRALFMAVTEPPYFQPTERQCYRWGKDIFMQALMLEASRTHSVEVREMCLTALKEAEVFEVPYFPVKGQDLVPYGIVKGKGMGDFLKEVEEWWVENDFPTKEECLERVQNMVRKDRRKRGRAHMDVGI